MPVDPEVQARIAHLSGVDPATAPPATERIAAAAAAFAALGVHSAAVRTAPVAIWSTGADDTVISWNDMAARLFGWSAGEVVGHLPPFTLEPTGRSTSPGPPRLAGPPSRPDHAVDTTGTTGTGTAVHAGMRAAAAPTALAAARPVEHLGRHRDGRELLLLISTTETTGTTGTTDPPVTVWVATDVTDELAAARVVALEHERWRRLLPGLAETVVILDERGLIREVIAAEQPTILGHPVEGFAGSSTFALLDPAELDRAWLVWERVLSNPGREYRDTFRTRHADGHFELVEYTALNLVSDPVVNGIVLTGRLVTARREHEALINGETEVLNLIARGAPLEDTLAAVTRIVETNTHGLAGVLLLRSDAREFEIGTPGSVPVPLLEILRRAPLTPSLEFETIDFRRVTVISDVGSDRRTAPLAEATEAFGTRSAWSIPIIENRTDELLGLIAAPGRTPALVLRAQRRRDGVAARRHRHRTPPLAGTAVAPGPP